MNDLNAHRFPDRNYARGSALPRTWFGISGTWQPPHDNRDPAGTR